MVGIRRKLRPLAGFKIHHIGSLGGTFLQHQLPGLFQGCGIEAEGLVALLGSGNALENQITGGPCPDGFHLGRHMGQDTDLGRNFPMLLNLLEPPQHLAHLLRGIRHRVQTDHRISRTEGQTFQGGSSDALRIIGGMVRLQAAAQSSRQADGGIAVGGDGDFVGCIDQIQIAHQLADCGNHLRR